MQASLLVPLDGSPFAEHALPVAFSIARRAGARLHLVRVHELPVLPVGNGESVYTPDPDWLEALRGEDEEYLRVIADRCTALTGLVVRTELLPGPVADAVVEVARKGEDSMIVMTTHGRGGISRAWLGSIADAVVRRSGVPVLLVRPRTEDVAFDAPSEVRHVLIPVDGSALSASILDAATWLGGVTGARYTLLRVLPSWPIPPHALGIYVTTDPEGWDNLRREARIDLEALATPLRQSGATVETIVVENQLPAAAILEQADARGVDMIALATHGRGGWKRMALKSVADKVMRGARVPVLLYRPPVKARAAGSTKESVHMA